MTCGASQPPPLLASCVDTKGLTSMTQLRMPSGWCLKSMKRKMRYAKIHYSKIHYRKIRRHLRCVV
jgi:hypothetical protein